MAKPAPLLVAALSSMAALPLLVESASSTAQGPGHPRAFELQGSQPFEFVDYLQPGQGCSLCHGGYNPAVSPYDTWKTSLMAQSARDPIFHAGLAIAEQDLGGSGLLCLRCHTPGAYMEGRALPTDGSGLDPWTNDFDGVTCHVCHRLVDPVSAPENPQEDAGILAALTRPVTVEPHSGMFVLDPHDRRRGPFDLGPNFSFHEFRVSPFHRDSLLCATCHDVSNPALEPRPNGNGYRLTNLNAAHPTQDKHDMFPIERTYSEWTRSVYAVAPIDSDGRFGGNQPEVQSCQDCHMPTVHDRACSPGLGGVLRPDMPLHTFAGANSWVLSAVRSLFPDSETGLSASGVQAAEARNADLMTRAADLQAHLQGEDLVVRVVNRTGHKLPTGYAEGRRMWLEVQWFDASDALLRTDGGYDDGTATLDAGSTRVWEILHGLDDYMAAITGKPAGESFHFVLNNVTLKDNRIPARGFTQAAYEEVGADVVAAHYDDQQHWDDAVFQAPAGAVRAQVRLRHQTTSREYIEFLRDENTTNGAGQQAYDLWEQHGKSAPVTMGTLDVDLQSPPCGAPLDYGLGTESSLGVRPELIPVGSPSASGPGFELQLSGGLPGELAVLWMGTSLASAPHLGGTLLVGAPQRIGTVVADASGKAGFPVPLDATMVGSDRFFQVIQRDPGAASGAVLTAGLAARICD